MNEQLSFERLIADQIVQEGTATPPAGALDEILTKAGEMRPMPRWLALIKEPPMRLSHNVAVGSPAVRVAAVMVATLLLALLVAGAGFAGSRLLAAEMIIVAQDGSGAYTTIGAAVATAEDGDEILVMPGTYAESITIDKDITLRGDDRDGVVIESAAGCIFDDPTDRVTCVEGTPLYDGFWFEPEPYGLLLQESDARISDLTFRSLVDGYDVVIRGGAPSIERIANADGSAGGLYVHDGSAATILHAELKDGWILVEEQSPVTIEDSTFVGLTANTNNTPITGGPATIRNNVARGIAFNGSALVEGNTLVGDPDGEGGFYDSGIDVQAGEGWIIKDNTLEGFPDIGAISVMGGSGTISGNRLSDNVGAINAGTGGDTIIENNTVTGGGFGILTAGNQVVTGNTVTGATGRGFVVNGHPTLRDNTSCDNGENLAVSPNGSADIDGTNEICEDATSR